MKMEGIVIQVWICIRLYRECYDIGQKKSRLSLSFLTFFFRVQQAFDG